MLYIFFKTSRGCNGYSGVDSWLESWSGIIKDHTTAICCFTAKYGVLRSKSKDWLAHNHDNVSEWTFVSVH